MLRALRLSDAELSIVLCDDRRMRALNRRHRGIDRTTDVLAFALHDGLALIGADARMLGDVVISLPTAARQARATHKQPVDEVRMLLAHGLLHLLGVDLRTRAEERRMSARCDALLAAALAAPQSMRGKSATRRASSAGSRPAVGYSPLAAGRIASAALVVRGHRK
jgi:probable rRNA maturation factor